jgi:antitoxin ParD1/3/4
MPSENVTLSDHQAEFIRQRVGEGRYRDVSDVVGAGLRLLEQREAQDRLKLEALRRIATDSFAEIDRGDFQIVDPDRLDEFLSAVDGKSRSI